VEAGTAKDAEIPLLGRGQQDHRLGHGGADLADQAARRPKLVADDTACTRNRPPRRNRSCSSRQAAM
jgi:hypothetical protein